MKKINKSKIPIFKNEDEEAEFQGSHDLTDYLDEFEEIEMTFIDNRKKTVNGKINSDSDKKNNSLTFKTL